MLVRTANVQREEELHAADIQNGHADSSLITSNDFDAASPSMLAGLLALLVCAASGLALAPSTPAPPRPRV